MCANSERSTFPAMNKILILALVVLAYSSAYSQSFLSGFGLEVGGGHNQLFWSAPAQYLSPNSSTTANRTDLSFTPTIRVNYKWDIAPWLTLSPFIGYSQFGGKDKQPNGYQDQFWFDAIELGLFGLYPVQDFSFGFGMKANYHLKVTGRYFGSFDQTTSANAYWHEVDQTDYYTRWSGDAGARASYRYDHFTFSFDAWFGITHLQQGLLSHATIRENQFRVLVGYTL